MPTRPLTRDEIKTLVENAMVAAELADTDDESDEEFFEDAFLTFCEEIACKRLIQNVSEERLSLERLQREHAASGLGVHDVSWNVENSFGFPLRHLPLVVQALHTSLEAHSQAYDASSHCLTHPCWPVSC